ncbi:MAG TPA: cysteine desulfurase NifS [Clostridiales bacterium]|nr:MAG: cysteine desulfurase NifS [Clostridiales bacterium GWD2_32_59]HAN09197.1 cysteine desulfurase NifS [Clostridiales bacterium]
MIYLDNSATTPVKKEVMDEMIPYFTEIYGNPSSLYKLSRDTKRNLEDARERVAKLLGAEKDEIYFTASGTESDNWAIKQLARANKKKGNHIITTKIEHHAILHACEEMEKEGFEVTYLEVDSEGKISLDDLIKSIKDETILITIMYANNEIGSIMPIPEIGKIAREKGITFHTDAVQAVGKLNIDVKKENIDMLSLSGHKFNGPRGIGVLYIRKGIKINSFMHGGGQERGKRAGTENVPGIMGLAKAFEISMENREEKNKKSVELRDYLIERVLNEIPYSILNGHRTDRLPNNANFCFRFIEGESLLLALDNFGICASSGSACTSGSLDPSHVLLAIGLPHEIAHGSLRLSLSDETTKEEIDFTIEKLKSVVERLRNMSPLWEDFVRNGGKDNV